MNLEKLFTSGQLTGAAKEYFLTLKQIHQEEDDIAAAQAENARQAAETFTGTTADSIADSVIQGFEGGLKGAADFADNFESLMKNAVLQSLKFQALEQPLKQFYDNFAKAAQSDGILTESEIKQLHDDFNGIIDDAEGSSMS
jgi:hypothetical protein